MEERQQKLLKYIKDIKLRDSITPDHFLELRQKHEAGLSPKAKLIAFDRSFDVWQRFDKDENLSKKDFVHLESVILQDGLRPAYDIQDDSYENMPPVWQLLNDRRSAIKPLIRGIGRLDLVGHPIKRNVGTGFICGERILMTNRHVADEFVSCPGDGSALIFNPGITANLDLKQEVNNLNTQILKIASPITILENWDIAIFEFQQLPNSIPPLSLAIAPPKELDTGMAVVVGYPLLDPESNLLQQLQIFRSVFAKKRLMPGRLKGLITTTSYGRTVEALGHDCTTLGGNSGSAVIDVKLGAVVGVHFAGQYLVSNYAVPTWELANDPQIKNRGLNFVKN